MCLIKTQKEVRKNIQNDSKVEHAVQTGTRKKVHNYNEGANLHKST